MSFSSLLWVKSCYVWPIHRIWRQLTVDFLFPSFLLSQVLIATLILPFCWYNPCIESSDCFIIHPLWENSSAWFIMFMLVLGRGKAIISHAIVLLFAGTALYMFISSRINKSNPSFSVYVSGSRSPRAWSKTCQNPPSITVSLTYWMCPSSFVQWWSLSSCTSTLTPEVKSWLSPKFPVTDYCFCHQTSEISKDPVVFSNSDPVTEDYWRTKGCFSHLLSKIDTVIYSNFRNLQ